MHNQGMTSPVSVTESERALLGLKGGKVMHSDDTPVEVRQSQGPFRVLTPYKLFNRIMTTEGMQSAWRDSIPGPIFKGNGDIQECKNYCGIKLLTHLSSKYRKRTRRWSTEG